MVLADLWGCLNRTRCQPGAVSPALATQTLFTVSMISSEFSGLGGVRPVTNRAFSLPWVPRWGHGVATEEEKGGFWALKSLVQGGALDLVPPRSSPGDLCLCPGAGMPPGRPDPHGAGQPGPARVPAMGLGAGMWPREPRPWKRSLQCDVCLWPCLCGLVFWFFWFVCCFFFF